ncbi:MAG: hypothetical protein WCK29_02940 [archaeon]
MESTISTIVKNYEIPGFGNIHICRTDDQKRGPFYASHDYTSGSIACSYQFAQSKSEEETIQQASLQVHESLQETKNRLETKLTNVNSSLKKMTENVGKKLLSDFEVKN